MLHVDVMKLKRERKAKLDEMQKIISDAEQRADKKLTDVEDLKYKSLRDDVSRLDKEILDGEADFQSTVIDLTGTSARSGKMTTGRNFRSMFPNLAGNEGFRDSKEFFEVLASGRFDERMQNRAAQEGVGALGGFAVPVETGGILWDRSLELSIVKPRAQIWPMESAQRTVPAFNSQDTSTDVYGFVGQWLGELQEADVQDPIMRAIKHVAKKLAIFTALSREIHADGVDFASQMETALIKALAHFQDMAFISGDGLGKPLGILNAPCTIEVDRSNANDISFTDICNMYARLLPGSFKNAIWLVNQAALPKLMLMTDTAGNLIWKPGEPLAGIPVEITEKVPTLGSRGDITLADFSCYSIGNRAEIAIDTTNAFKWTNDRMDVRAIIRCDGQPVFSQPVKNAQGNTTSPFVVLK